MPEEKEKILNFSKKLCLKIKSEEFAREDLLLVFRIIDYLSNYPESAEACDLFDSLLKTIKRMLDEP